MYSVGFTGGGGCAGVGNCTEVIVCIGAGVCAAITGCTGGIDCTGCGVWTAGIAGCRTLICDGVGLSTFACVTGIGWMSGAGAISIKQLDSPFQ